VNVTCSARNVVASLIKYSRDLDLAGGDPIDVKHVIVIVNASSNRPKEYSGTESNPLNMSALAYANFQQWKIVLNLQPYTLAGFDLTTLSFNLLGGRQR
jgi:hypothetical protein